MKFILHTLSNYFFHLQDYFFHPDLFDESHIKIIDNQ